MGDVVSSILTASRSGTSTALARLDACGVVSPLPSMSTGEAVLRSPLIFSTLSVVLVVVFVVVSEAEDEAVSGRRTFSLGGRVV